MILAQGNNAEPFRLRTDHAPDGFLSADLFVRHMRTPEEFGRDLRNATGND